MRSHFNKFIIFALAAAVFLFVAGYRSFVTNAQVTPPLTYGTLDNFDVINDTGGETHGFEIELEGISTTDVAYTFGAPYQRYGDPTVTATATGVIIRYAAVYSAGGWISTVQGAPGGTPIAVAPYLPTQGHSCWTGGVTTPNDYYTAGCDHFGASLNATPTKTTYRWLVENTSAPGTLVPFGTIAPLPAPVWNVIPAATPGAQPVAEVAIAPPAVPDGAMWGQPMWVKVYTTELPNAVHAEDLEHMVIDDPNVNIVPNEPVEIEFEWVLLQAGPNGNGEQIFGGGAEVGAGNEAVSRRFEFYKYTGYLDPDPGNLGEATCDNPTAPDQQVPDRCGTPDANGVAGVGDMIGAQNAAVNLMGPVVVIPENHAPVANVDSETTAEDTPLTISPATLLANDTDRDGNAINFHSVQNAIGGTVSFDGTNIVFTPDGNYNGAASFWYTIDDGYLNASTIVSITVTPVNDAPVASAGGDQTVRTRNIVTLDGSGSYDIDVGDSLTYSWSFSSVPAHSRAVFNNSTLMNPSFEADKAGTYNIQLVVNDGTVNSVADSVTVTVAKGKK
jgi:hypothetical protein